MRRSYSYASLVLPKLHSLSSTSHQKIGRHHLYCSFSCECKFFFLCRHSGFTMNMNILCNSLQGGRKCLWKTYNVSSLLTLWASQQRSLFNPNCRVDAYFLKAIDWKWHSWGAGEEPWMETVDSHFHPSPAVSSIAAWHWRRGRGPCLHMVFFMVLVRQCLSLPLETEHIVMRGFFSKGQCTQQRLHRMLPRVLVWSNCHH